MGTSRRRTPVGARLNYGARRRPDRVVLRHQKNRQAAKKFKGANEKFLRGDERLLNRKEAQPLARLQPAATFVQCSGRHGGAVTLRLRRASFGRSAAGRLPTPAHSLKHNQL